ncbi:MAG: YbaK/EbsC family protein [Oscillospiraceae bacterium]
MSLEKASAHLSRWGRDKDILLLEASTATVPQAAEALGVEPARIAKSISLRCGDKIIVLVTAGDCKIDNARYKAQFGAKAKMLSPEEALEHTGHAVGGVCPFGLPQDVEVYLDSSMRRFNTVFPACGTANSAIRLTCEELDSYSLCSDWVDVCKSFQA